MNNAGYRLFFLFMCFRVYVFAQDGTNQESLKDRFRTGDLNLSTSSASMIYGFDNAEKLVVGTAYYDEKWRVANIQFYPKLVRTPQGDVHLDTVNGVAVRVNLKDNLVEFYTPEQTKALPAGMIKRITFPDFGGEVLQNVADFYSDKYRQGFLKKRYTGNRFQLFEVPVVIIKQPDYNQALNVGSKDIRVIKEFRLVGTTGKELVSLSSKKEILSFLENDALKAEKIMKEKSFSYKNTNDLIQLLQLLEEE